MLRTRDYHGNIFISGGGDSGVIDLPSYDPVPLADWMAPTLPEDYRRAALSDAAEFFDYGSGWTASGVPEAEVGTADAPPFYTGFRGASRLLNDCRCADPHGSTVQDDLEGAHMYLACKAGL